MMHAPVSATVILLLCLGSAGCATTFIAETDFPSPTIERLPLSVAVYYDDYFRTFEQQGMSPRGARWTAKLGAANMAAFDRLFGALFAGSHRVSSGEPVMEPIDADALLAPEMESFRLAMPGDFDQRYFTVWIEYRLRMLAPNGDLIADWLISASGKSLPHGLSPRQPMQQATYLAMRDATAIVSVEFRKQPEIRKWLLDNGMLARNPKARTSTGLITASGQ